MSALLPARGQDYLYTIPMCPDFITGQGMGINGSYNVTRMEDVSFLSEMNREFNECWYLNFWNTLINVNTRYSPDFSNLVEHLKRPIKYPYIRWPESRLAEVNRTNVGTNTPLLYYDDNARIDSFTQSLEYDHLCGLDEYLDISPNISWRIEDAFSSIDRNRETLSESEIEELYRIHRRLMTIRVALDMYEEYVLADFDEEHNSSRKYWTSSGTGEDTKIEYVTETDPTTHTYTQNAIPSGSIPIYEFYGHKEVYSDEAEEEGETIYTDQCYSISSTEKTISDIGTMFVPITSAGNDSSGSRVFAHFTDTIDKIKVLCEFHHHRTDTGSDLNPKSDRYMLIDMTSSISSYGKENGTYGVYLDLDLESAKSHFSNVEDSIKDPAIPSAPPYRVYRTVHSKIYFLGFWIVIKPKWRCSFT